MSEVKSSDPAVQTSQASPVSAPQPKSDYARLIEAVLKETKIPCAFIFPSGERLQLGPDTEPAFTITFNSDKML